MSSKSSKKTNKPTEHDLPMEVEEQGPVDVVGKTRGAVISDVIGAKDWTKGLTDFIATADPHFISDDLRKKIGDIRGLDYITVAKHLIDVGAAFLLAQSIEDFPDTMHNQIAHLLIDSGHIYDLVAQDYISYYKGPLDNDIAYAIAELRMGPFTIFANIKKFPKLDHEKIVDFIINKHDGSTLKANNPAILDGFDKKLQKKLRNKWPELGVRK